MVEDVTMCRKRKSPPPADTTPFNQADIDAALAAEKQAAADAATAKAAAEDAAAEDASKVQDTDTKKESTESLDEKLSSMGGTTQAIQTIQNTVFQEVKGATEKEKMETRKRKEQQLQRAVRQRRRSGTMGRRSLITGSYGGRGYRG